MADTLAFLDATASADLVRKGQASPLELVDAAINRIEKLDPDLNSVIHPLFESAWAAATEPPIGLFRGVPMVVKDMDSRVAGTPCHQGNKLLQAIDWHDTHDSYLTARLRSAGFVFVGKTNTPEFGYQPTTEPLAYGPTHNPWNLDHGPGGSSGGSAAAVAAGMVPVGHAGDAGGSTRVPASACGVFGLKPSRGRVSLGPETGEGVAGLVNRHVITRSVRDSASILDLLAGPMPGDPYVAPPPTRPFAEDVGAPPGRLRIAVRTVVPGSMVETHPDCFAAAYATAGLLESLGHTVEEASPDALDDPAFVDFYLVVITSWVVRDLQETARKAGREVGPDDVEPLTWAYGELGRAQSAERYIEAVQAMHAWSRRIAQWWSPVDRTAGFDLLLTPTMAAPPPLLGELVPTAENPFDAALRAAPYGLFTSPFNVTGQPAMSVPLYWGGDGLPIGTQLVAGYGREDLLFQVASQLEMAHPWADRRPPAHAD